METIDLFGDGDLTADMFRDRELNEHLITFDIPFYHNTLQECAGVNEELLKAAPAGTHIIEAAAGPITRFKKESLFQKQLELIALDQDEVALEQRADSSLSVIVDLDKLPRRFDWMPLREGLSSLATNKRIAEARECVQFLLKVLAERNAGLWIFSSCLPGFTDASVQRLMKMASMHLHTIGTVALFESSWDKHYLKLAIEVAAASPSPLVPIRDEVLVPLLTHEQYESMNNSLFLQQQLVGEIEPFSFIMDKLFVGMTEGQIPVIRIDPKLLPAENPGFAELTDRGGVAAIGWSQRFVQLTPQKISWKTHLNG